MKNLTSIFILLILLGCEGQQIPKDIDGFADKNYLATNKSNAIYYRQHKVIENIMGVNINPNANPDFGQVMPDEYGSAYTLTNSGIQLHEITFYNFQNKKILEAGALFKIETGEYELYGQANWFDEKGNKTETGFYNTNVRGNYYEKYNKTGTVIDSGYYVNGKKFTDFTVDERLLGKWLCYDSYIDELGGEVPTLLFNRFNKSGVIEIWQEAPESDFDFINEIEPDIARLHYSFEKTGTNSGLLTTIDYWTGREDKEKIEFISSDQFVSTITDHPDKSIIGKESYLLRFKINFNILL